MKCPGCKKEITKVRVYSECWQWGSLENNKVVHYSPYEDFSDSITDIECPECSLNLDDVVEV